MVSHCGTYLHVYVRQSCQDCLWYYALLDGKPIEGEIKLTPIITEFNAEYDYVTNDGTVCYVRTNRNAPNFRLVKIDLDNPSEVKRRLFFYFSFYHFYHLGKLDRFNS